VNLNNRDILKTACSSERNITGRKLLSEKDGVWGLYNWRHFTNAERTLNRTMTIAGVYEPSFRDILSLFAWRERVALYNSYLQNVLCKRRFIPARPIKHEDHARIVRPAATDVALLVSLIVVSDRLTFPLILVLSRLSFTFVRSFILNFLKRVCHIT